MSASPREVRFAKAILEALREIAELPSDPRDPIYDETVKEWLESKIRDWLGGLDPEILANMAKAKMPPSRDVWREEWLEGAKHVLGLMVRMRREAGEEWRVFTKEALTEFYRHLPKEIAGPVHMIWRRVNEMEKLGLVRKLDGKRFAIEGNWIEGYVEVQAECRSRARS
jgi:hypothetical protein